MKLLLQTTALFSLVQLSNSECLETFTISADSCTYQGFVDSVVGVNVDCDRRSWLLQTFGSLDSAKETVTKACTDAYLPFDAITNQGPLFNQEYYNGGTYMNEERETINEHGIALHRLANNPGNRMKNVYNDIAQSRGITWPDNLVNFESCKYNAAMCCFTQDRYADGNGDGNCKEPYDENCVDANPADNTDVCYVDMARSPIASRTSQGFVLFEKNAEEDSHCHGFVWSEDPDDASTRFRGNSLFFVSMYDHLTQRGYVRNVPGAPMCACVEQMPVVTRSDCTEIEIENEKVQFTFANGLLSATFDEIDVTFNSCQADPNNGNDNNDLSSQYEHFVANDDIDEEKLEFFTKTVVGKTYCRESIDLFLDSQGLAKKAACKYADQSECGCDEVLQKDYRGDKATTIGNLECQRWDAQEPQSHSRTRKNYPDDNLVENYCRNPDDEPNGSWCYTTDADVRWQHCGVPTCKLPAPEPDPGTLGQRCGTDSTEIKQADYRGDIAFTEKGFTCQRWDTQDPHEHTYNDVKFPDFGLDRNYCRNPDGEPRTWCYTTDASKRWDFCVVPAC